MILTEAELEARTRKRRHRARARVLQAMGITFRLRGDGSVVVSRVHLDKLLGANSATPSINILPNWSALA